MKYTGLHTKTLTTKNTYLITKLSFTKINSKVKKIDFYLCSCQKKLFIIKVKSCFIQSWSNLMNICYSYAVIWPKIYLGSLW